LIYALEETVKKYAIILIVFGLSIAADTTAEATMRAAAKNDYCKAKVGAKGLKGSAFTAEMIKCRDAYPNYE
jgi:hypothetical protein